ncbi:MAG TPA: response regulator [Stellaceae bacterium]|jgi:DNA-binding NtrC family response regulator|nr:response regulator [Stellaceae bacterium]
MVKQPGILRRMPIDLVVADQAMPPMTGLQLVQAIAAEWPRLPTILVSGHAELPSDAYPELIRLGKPFRQEQLSRAIAQSLKGDRRT